MTMLIFMGFHGDFTVFFMGFFGFEWDVMRYRIYGIVYGSLTGIYQPETIDLAEFCRMRKSVWSIGYDESIMIYYDIL
jgi:hypothetical protein